MSNHRVDLGPEWAQMGEGVPPSLTDEMLDDVGFYRLDLTALRNATIIKVEMAPELPRDKENTMSREIKDVQFPIELKETDRFILMRMNDAEHSLAICNLDPFELMMLSDSLRNEAKELLADGIARLMAYITED